MSATNDFTGRVVLVTGGAHGVGRAICSAFAARGAHVIVNCFHSRQEAPQFISELTESGGSAELVWGSVAIPQQVHAMFQTITERHGRLDVLVNNAAQGRLASLSDLTDTDWDRALDTTLHGVVRCSRQAQPLLAARGGGAIVNLSSLGSQLVIGNYAAVGVTKAGVEALTRYLAVDLAASNIRVNTACGGLLDSRVASQFPKSDSFIRRVEAATPLGHRLGREAELAELVVFLASPAASWITGQTVVADGGLSLGSTMLSPEPDDETLESGRQDLFNKPGLAPVIP